MKAAQQKARYGDVREISRDEYVREVNQAGEGVWVILLVYKPSLVPALSFLLTSCIWVVYVMMRMYGDLWIKQDSKMWPAVIFIMNEGCVGHVSFFHLQHIKRQNKVTETKLMK